ncbi:MAG: hypothetical protein JNJ65_09110 [Cyclobacteriaceae bacterium]|nr:hypothetical protein [Cyclobacteriaceae bacterium]
MRVGIFFIIGLISCTQQKPEPMTGTYRYDAEFLKKNTRQVIELQDPTGQAKILLSADYQGRVMTSTSTGDEGMSYGWLNYELIGSGEKRKQFNPVGGEERFWLGPEGGQFSLYFSAGDSFAIENWQVPPFIDTVSYDVAEQSTKAATFVKQTVLTNYSGTQFELQIERRISLVEKNAIEASLQVSIPDELSLVAYQTENTIRNTGTSAWTKDSGLISIWLLGMFTPSEKTVAIIPFHPFENARELISTNYFGEIPSERLTINDSVLYFTCDGKYRSKIGLPPSIAKPLAASFDFQKNILTVIYFDVDADGDYVNSKWVLQQEPFRGDAVNSYNDGPLADGSQLGPFYELESSSPALALKPGAKGTYRQLTFHATGNFEKLNQLSQHVLSVNLADLKK